MEKARALFISTRKILMVSTLMILLYSCQDDHLKPIQEVPTESMDSTGSGNDDEQGGSPGNT